MTAGSRGFRTAASGRTKLPKIRIDVDSVPRTVIISTASRPLIHSISTPGQLGWIQSVTYGAADCGTPTAAIGTARRCRFGFRRFDNVAVDWEQLLADWDLPAVSLEKVNSSGSTFSRDSVSDEIYAEITDYCHMDCERFGYER